MANNHTFHQNANFSSFSLTDPDPEPDDISVFLRHILLPSSSSANEMQCSPYFLPKNQHGESCSMLNSFSGTMNNDPDEYECECESEGGTEDLVMEGSAQPPLPRNSSKRSRAAEVHNLSEKRRRSRINEKMKALQKLIPNSNKTDKASMLDEAIEYLKQLQLQVQMLSMRNGFKMYPLGLQRALQQNQLSQLRMSSYFPGAKVAGPLNVNQDTSLNAIFSSPKRTPVPTMSNVNHSDNMFQSINVQLDPFNSTKEDWFPPKTMSTGPNDTYASDHDTLESCLRYHLGNVNETNMDTDQQFYSQVGSHPLYRPFP